jgi:predicted nucleotidyltransferase
MSTQRKIKVNSLDEIKEVIERHRPELKSQFHVDKIGVFGSYARGDQKKRSDIDFLVTFDEPVSYLDLGGLKIFMEEITGLESHVVPSYNLRPEFRDNILKQVKYIE